MDNKERFAVWQESECARIGCTVEQHNSLLEIADNYAAAGFGWNYYSLAALVIAERKWKEFVNVYTAESKQASHGPRRRHISKKLRRNL